MALDFPANPSDGEVFGSYVWSASKGVWQSREESAAPAVVSPVPPTTTNTGDIWVDSSDGIAYVYYDDGSSGQWIEMISSGVVSLASKANLDGGNTFTGVQTLDTPLAITSGGTGANSFTSGAYLKGNGSTNIVQQTGVPAGDITSGTLSSARLPSGTVLQVVHSARTASSSVSGSYSWGTTNIAATITPRSTSSRIKVSANIIVSCSQAGWIFMRVLRGSTPVGVGSIGTTINTGAVTYIQDFGRIEPINQSFVDSPSTTSAVTYTIQFAAYAGTGYLNRRGADTLFGGHSSLTLEEIA